MKALVLAGFGVNCEVETAAAWRRAGIATDVVHLADLIGGQARLAAYRALTLPGGFSFGDALGAGTVLAARLRHARLASGAQLWDELAAFRADGGLILGVCNGFQVLVRTGLLPDLAGEGVPEVALAPNAGGRFEDRWCTLAPGPAAPPGLPARLRLPVRHAEGRLVCRDAAVAAALPARLLFTYVDAAGAPATAYPANPSGAALACAGLRDASGRVLGLMPHPEAALSPLADPGWRRRDESPAAGDGLAFFAALAREVLR